MSYYPDFAEKLNQLLVGDDRTPAWLAHRLDVNPSTVNRWLNHGSRPGDPDTVARIADILGASGQLQELLVAAGYGYLEAAGDGAAAIADEPPEDVTPSAPSNNLPVQATALVGRVDELTALREWFGDPAVRLATVVGPGGIGKTRLAVSAAEDQVAAGRFQDGVHFVALAAITARQSMVTAIADALGFSSAGSDLEAIILNQLRARSALIVLDNFEQLVTEADFVADILASAANVKLLVTTRERLNLQEEWVLDLPGLAYPQIEVQEGLADYDSAKLFMQRAVQVNGRFTPERGEVASISTICRLVQGMPLGLELAAGWTRVMTPEEIVREIEQGIDFFSTTVRNVPERHRSLRAVFRQSWQMLTPSEQRAYAALSVFRGGFSREAATEVAGVSLPVLVSLADKSLVRHTQRGRYEVHELLRQYAAEKLEEDADLESAARHAHAAFYCQFLADRTQGLRSSGQLQALAEIRAEQENVQSAWYAAVDRKQFHLMEAAADSWFNFAEFGGYPRQGYQGLDYALQAIDNHEQSKDGVAGRREDDLIPDEQRTLLARVLTRHAYLLMRIGGAHPQGIAEWERSRALLTQTRQGTGMDVQDELAFVQNVLGLWVYFTGDEDKAEAYIRSALKLGEEIEDAVEIGTAWLYLGHLAEFQGRYTEAAALFSKSIDFFVQVGERNRKAYSLNNWGRACYGMGDYDQAESLVHRGRAIREDFNDLVGMSYSLLDLGRIADCRGDYVEAERLMQEGLTITRTMANHEVSARCLMGLGDVALHRRQSSMAERYFDEARGICEDLAVSRHRPVYLAGLGQAAYQRQGAAAARDLFERSLRYCLELGNVGEEAKVRLALAQIALDEARIDDSARDLQRCFEIAAETGARPVALAAIVLGAPLVAVVTQHDAPSPAELLTFVAQHSATWHHTRRDAERLLAQVDGPGIAQYDLIEESRGESADVGPAVQAMSKAYRRLCAQD